MLKMIVAHDKENGIGKNNKLPWSIPEDLRRFSKLTRGNGNNAVIMGRKTYESIGKLLPGRVNIVLSKSISTENNENNLNLKIFACKNEVMEFIQSTHFDDVWIIGGYSVYREFFDKVKELYVTEINGNFDCDTFFISDYEKEFSNTIVEDGGITNYDNTVFYKKYFS